MIQIIGIILIVAFIVYMAIRQKNNDQQVAVNAGTEDVASPVQPDNNPLSKPTNMTAVSAQEKAPADSDQGDQYAGQKAYQLVMTLTKELGCQPEEDEDNHIHFNYQGEHFFVDAQKDGVYACIYDTWWHTVQLSDLDEFADARRAVNSCNYNYTTTLVYSIDENDNRMGVHCRSPFVLVPEIPNVRDYFRSRLDDCFLQHRNFYKELEEIRKKRLAETT